MLAELISAVWFHFLSGSYVQRMRIVIVGHDGDTRVSQSGRHIRGLTICPVRRATLVAKTNQCSATHGGFMLLLPSIATRLSVMC